MVLIISVYVPRHAERVMQYLKVLMSREKSIDFLAKRLQDLHVCGC